MDFVCAVVCGRKGDKAKTGKELYDKLSANDTERAERTRARRAIQRRHQIVHADVSQEKQTQQYDQLREQHSTSHGPEAKPITLARSCCTRGQTTRRTSSSPSSARAFASPRCSCTMP